MTPHEVEVYEGHMGEIAEHSQTSSREVAGTIEATKKKA
jgi:hypothetical protein